MPTEELNLPFQTTYVLSRILRALLFPSETICAIGRAGSPRVPMFVRVRAGGLRCVCTWKRNI